MHIAGSSGIAAIANKTIGQWPEWGPYRANCAGIRFRFCLPLPNQYRRLGALWPACPGRKRTLAEERALSLATAIRDRALSGVTIIDMMEQMTSAYENALLLNDQKESLPICVRRSPGLLGRKPKCTEHAARR